MDEIFSPEVGLARIEEAFAQGDVATALVLPTTRAIHSRLRSPWVCVGGEGRGDVVRPVEILSALNKPDAPHMIVIHSDQLGSCVDATVRLQLANGEVFVSPVEMILNTKHRYRLFVWTATGLVDIEPKSPLATIATTLTRHLRDCHSLGDAWLERHEQVERTPLWRARNWDRQVRYLRSCVASAYRDMPDDHEARRLLERCAGLENIIQKSIAA